MSVAMHYAPAQQPLTTVSPNLNPTITMSQVELGFINKHNVISFRCPCLPFIAQLPTQTPVASSEGIRSHFLRALSVDRQRDHLRKRATAASEEIFLSSKVCTQSSLNSIHLGPSETMPSTDLKLVRLVEFLLDRMYTTKNPRMSVQCMAPVFSKQLWSDLELSNFSA
ncbi:hypothetical protein TNCV_4628291 [Trichonephila clavipes]|nr:hypothetical protein TNCV_4628291 [Trichonephila clavipes]